MKYQKMIKKFDLICSLGGNCSAAHNLEYRDLRKFSLPFDWTYIKNENAIYNLAECFKNNFKNFFLKENLQELTGSEYNTSHINKVQYKDLKTDYYWVNHFNRKIENSEEYEKVKQKIDRRIKRLLYGIQRSNNILFILSTNFLMKTTDPLKNLLKVLNKLYPEKNFYIKVISFNCEVDEYINSNNINYYKYKRAMNLYDFTKTNIEWAFLDDVELSDVNLNLGKKKRNFISFRLFNLDVKIEFNKRK